MRVCVYCIIMVRDTHPGLPGTPCPLSLPLAADAFSLATKTCPIGITSRVLTYGLVFGGGFGSLGCFKKVEGVMFKTGQDRAATMRLSGTSKRPRTCRCEPTGYPEKFPKH